jgi:hypothetical protein
VHNFDREVGNTAGFRFRCALSAEKMIDLTTQRFGPINLRSHHVVCTWTVIVDLAQSAIDTRLRF